MLLSLVPPCTGQTVKKLPALKVNLLSVNPLWKYPKENVQRYISQASLKLVKLKIKFDDHNSIHGCSYFIQMLTIHIHNLSTTHHPIINRLQKSYRKSDPSSKESTEDWGTDLVRMQRIIAGFQIDLRTQPQTFFSGC